MKGINRILTDFKGNLNITSWPGSYLLPCSAKVVSLLWMVTRSSSAKRWLSPSGARWGLIFTRSTDRSDGASTIHYADKTYKKLFCRSASFVLAVTSTACHKWCSPCLTLYKMWTGQMFSWSTWRLLLFRLRMKYSTGATLATTPSVGSVCSCREGVSSSFATTTYPPLCLFLSPGSASSSLRTSFLAG